MINGNWLRIGEVCNERISRADRRRENINLALNWSD